MCYHVTYLVHVLSCDISHQVYRCDLQACSEFLAGNALRSSTRYKALDETAVFGCACRHEFPLMFVNLKHGERYTCM